ncbi:hypothetical protein, partial [Mesomycoplasma ovipneumoniae]|uniref:hypothetical protein n=1 Tax=Mesomycoplasma ovipneumoniae TaxID=29562 RepID=UPI0030803C12
DNSHFLIFYGKNITHSPLIQYQNLLIILSKVDYNITLFLTKHKLVHQFQTYSKKGVSKWNNTNSQLKRNLNTSKLPNLEA